PWLLNFRFPVADLGPIPDGELSRHARLRAGLLALKYGTRDPQSQMAALDQIVAALAEAPELLLPVLLYLLTTFQNLDDTHVQQAVRRINLEEKYTMMSLFAREILSGNKPEWVELVRQEIRQEVRQEEAASMLLKLMRRKFGQTPDWVSEKVKSAELELIEIWSDNFVFANTVDEVFVS
ncbi:MAG: hypothetical protein HQL95_08750, partial [Magnetococcales bacterium]|nr:hypothetical protein [Magnetococcales bacterium]